MSCAHICWHFMSIPNGHTVWAWSPPWHIHSGAMQSEKSSDTRKHVRTNIRAFLTSSRSLSSWWSSTSDVTSSSWTAVRVSSRRSSSRWIWPRVGIISAPMRSYYWTKTFRKSSSKCDSLMKHDQEAHLTITVCLNPCVSIIAYYLLSVLMIQLTCSATVPLNVHQHGADEKQIFHVFCQKLWQSSARMSTGCCTGKTLTSGAQGFQSLAASRQNGQPLLTSVTQRKTSLSCAGTEQWGYAPTATADLVYVANKLEAAENGIVWYNRDEDTLLPVIPVIGGRH